MCWRSKTGRPPPREPPSPPPPTRPRHNDGPVADPPWHPLPFHAVFDAPIYDGVRQAHSKSFRPKAAAQLETRIRALANERLEQRLRRGTCDLTQEYGGIVAASVVCEFLGIPVDLAPEVLASVNAGSLAEPGSGVATAQAGPNSLDYLIPSVKKRRANTSGDSLPVVDGLMGYRLPDERA